MVYDSSIYPVRPRTGVRRPPAPFLARVPAHGLDAPATLRCWGGRAHARAGTSACCRCSHAMGA